MIASIVIITKNQKLFLEKTIPNILRQKIKGDYEVIVVDSGSTDGALEYLKEKLVKIISFDPKNFNYAKAFNMGAKTSKGEFLVRLSGDVVPIGDNWLEDLLQPFSNSKVGATYGEYIARRKGYGVPEWWIGRFPTKETTYSFKPSFLKDLLGLNRLELFNLAGGFCAIRKKVWEKRGFNENLSAGEDGDYAWLIHVLDYDIVFTPKARAIHEHLITRDRKSFWLSLLFSRYMYEVYFSRIKYWLHNL